MHALGLKTAQGMYLTDSWYWNQSPEARAWSRRFFEKMKRMPSSLQAADYSAVSHYLKAVEAQAKLTPDVMKAMSAAGFNAALTPYYSFPEFFDESIHLWWRERYSDEELLFHLAAAARGAPWFCGFLFPDRHLNFELFLA